MPAPFAERLQELLDGLLLGPKIAMQNGDISDRAGALLRDELLDGRVPGGGILNGYRPLVFSRFSTLAIQFGHGFTSSLRV
jgi:hypothetical protein